MYAFAKKFGWAEQFVKNIKVEKGPGLGRAEHRDTLREINRGTWTIGYTGQSLSASSCT